MNIGVVQTMTGEVRTRQEGPPGVQSAQHDSTSVSSFPLGSLCRLLGQAPDSSLTIKAQHPWASVISSGMAVSPKMGQRELSLELELLLFPFWAKMHRTLQTPGAGT